MKKKAEPTFWLRDNHYIMLTGEVWQDCVFVAFFGDTPESVTEQGLMKNQLDDAKQVEPWAVPLEWWRAFSALYDGIEPNPPVKPAPPRPEPQVEAEEELLMHVAAGTDPLTAGFAAVDRFRRRAYRPVKGPCPLSFFTGMVVAFVLLTLVLLQCQ